MGCLKNEIKNAGQKMIQNIFCTFAPNIYTMIFRQEPDGEA